MTATQDRPSTAPATTDGSGVPFPGSRKTYLQGSRPTCGSRCARCR
jgi:hypothetical protein